MRLLPVITKLSTFLLLFATIQLAFAQNYRDYMNYKGEVDYKAELPPPPPCPVPCMLKDGFYIGAQIGYDSYRVHENFAFTTISGNPTVNATGWVGGLFAGYGRYLTQYFYLAAEGFGNYSDANTSYSIATTLGTYNSSLRVRQSYGISVLPGLMLNDTSLGYVRLGYNWAYFNSHENVAGSGSVNKTAIGSGFNYGVGIETLIYQNFSVRTEYTHTGFTSFSSPFSTSFSPSDNQFMVAAIYHFGC